MDAPLWQPSAERLRASNYARFAVFLGERGLPVPASFGELYAWSIRAPEQFWECLWHFAGVRASRGYERVLRDGDKMPGASWFEGARLNFAENLLRRTGDGAALMFRTEDDARRRVLSHDELRTAVARTVSFMRARGVRPGDRVAACLPNAPEAVIVMLAAAACGAAFSSCSPDFGLDGITDRFGQIEPVLLFGTDRYVFKSAEYAVLPKLREARRSIPAIATLVVVPWDAARPPQLGAGESAWSDLQRGEPAPLTFEQLPFGHPLYILYSSGTTGKPKCIVHSAGGTLLAHLKELLLHTDLKAGERLCYQTTCGWMMWNWMTSALAAECTLVLFDGSPIAREGRIIWDIAAEERVAVLGTNAKFLALTEKLGLTPGRTHDLSALRTVLSTGSPLSPESFDFVYREIKQDLCLSSISGGTDIVGCFALGAPAPVYRGELQSLSLGCKVDVFDENGRSLRGAPGELVCTAPFPNMPICFWNDPDGAKYHDAYFSSYPGVWRHGDWAEITPHGGMIVHGRSDATLKPGGVRIGTAEIYRQVESFPEVLEAVAVGQQWRGDQRVVLFVRMQPGRTLTPELQAAIRSRIKTQVSPFHVPAKMVEAPDIPRTRSGKIAELTIRDVIHGRAVKNLSALANPEALAFFEKLDELQQD